ncbi:MAG: hypothetical protein ACXVBQ_14625 [Pseudobdellovibrionaceae bacterium]
MKAAKGESMQASILKNILCFAYILSPSLTLAASHYIRSGASGSTCADWSNACGSLPASLIRGDTYYIANGSYAGRTFNTATSGTLPIIIKGAILADHGTDTGWSNSYSVNAAEGGSQAIWTSQMTFSTSYWVFDGSVGPVWSKTPSDYGFKIASTMVEPIYIGSSDKTNTTNFVISHIAATALSGDYGKVFVRTSNTSGQTDNVTISHNYLDGWANDYMATSPLGGTNYQDNWVFEYNVSLNGFSSVNNHGEDINNTYGIMNNQVTRYNWFEGRTSGTGVIVANAADNINAQVYGNVFKNMAAGNGLITGTSAGNLVSPQVYNNTFLNKSSDSGGWIGSNVTGTPLVYNNLIYNMDASMSVSGDYNAYFSATNIPTEIHGQIGSGNPFVNLSANDLRLSAPTLAGISLASPYNVDVLATLRGADGTFDRGAFEYASGSSVAPTLSAPTNLIIVN